MRREIARIVLAACLISIPAFIAQATTAAEAIACGDSRIPIPKFSVTVAELTFAGEPHFKVANLQQIVSDLKQQTYEGPTDGTLSELEERARRAWQDEGFFQVQVQSEATVLTSNPVSERVAVTLRVDEGEAIQVVQDYVQEQSCLD
jgi:outer membrane protein assembly factor BamA